MNDLIVQFEPYSVFSPPADADFDEYSFKIGDLFVSGSDSSDWFSLPDILFENKSRKFIGLSFQLNSENLVLVKSFMNQLSSSQIKLELDCGSLDRYKGFGDAPRFEVYFEISDNEICCEFASLYEGCWLFNVEKGDELSTQPYGYWLSMLDDIKLEHRLS